MYNDPWIQNKSNQIKPQYCSGCKLEHIFGISGVSDRQFAVMKKWSVKGWNAAE
jgi:hypothetical protein